jgi:hypothetical protein
MIQIFNKHNSADYKSWNQQHKINLDIYYCDAFLSQEALLNDGEYEIFTCTEESNVFVYPYIKINLGKQHPRYYDITSPYGYCGPYCNDEGLFLKAEELFIEHTRSQNVVSEFVRYHYLYNATQQFRHNISNSKNRTIVLLNTSQCWDNIWQSEFSGTNRNLVRKLENEGYMFDIVNYDSHIKEFIKMYYATMSNANAAGYYYFENDFFINLKKSLGDRLFIARVSKEDITYCYSLFFATGKFLTYYLSARNLEYPKIPATNLMLSKAANWAYQNNIAYFNLGGGLTDDEKDPLFRFKSNFSRQKASFYIGKRIHLQDKYNEIVDNWKSANGLEAYNKVKSKLQFYHKANEL